MQLFGIITVDTRMQSDGASMFHRILDELLFKSKAKEFGSMLACPVTLPAWSSVVRVHDALWNGDGSA